MSLKILIVDDDDVDREKVRRILAASSLDVEMEEADSAATALEQIDQIDYDGVVVDYHLGIDDGLVVLETIRETLKKRCAVIMITGLGDEEVAAEAMRLGANDYLVKGQLNSDILTRSVATSVRRSRQAESIHELAHYDSLTGLVSRHLLLDRLQHMINQADRNTGLSAVAFIDLDNFKPVNDSYGHEAGDNVLVQVAHRLKQSLRTTDTIARIGGDEFVILLESVNNADHCEDLLRRILLILNVPFTLKCKGSVRISGSIGVTLVNDQLLSADEVLRRADQAMYLAKKSGRNQVLFFDSEEEDKQKERRQLLLEIDHAVADNELQLYYQPLLDLNSGQVKGIEALIRWQHKTRGLLEPGCFIEALEHSTLGVQIGSWVIKQALQFRVGLTGLSSRCVISVNIAPHHLQSMGFVDALQALIDEVPGATPQMLQIEVLETESIKDMDLVVDILKACQKLGVTVALDDFGTGYASLSYLKRLPLNTLKIDRSFISNFLSDREDCAIVESIVALSRAFGYKLVAEGVESFEHIRRLKELGCSIGQGFFIARPMPADELIRWLEEGTNNSKIQEAAHGRFRVSSPVQPEQ